MIHYQLRCAEDHSFDGWFRSSDAFDAQAKAALLTCPVCGSAKVRRALMAPAVARAAVQAAHPGPAAEKPEADKAGPDTAAAEKTPTPGPAAVAGGVLPDGLRALLQRMRSEIEKRCDYVGPSFAEEARKIHHGESDARGIYGEATPDEAERLAEDGIEVASIPWLPRADS